MAIQIKAVEQYFAVGRAVCMWFKVVLAVVSVDEILLCEYSNKLNGTLLWGVLF